MERQVCDVVAICCDMAIGLDIDATTIEIGT